MDDRNALETRIQELEAKLARLEKRDTDRIDAALRTVLPDETRTHVRNAFREQLLAMRSILDHWIDKADTPDSAAPRERIKVE